MYYKTAVLLDSMTVINGFCFWRMDSFSPGYNNDTERYKYKPKNTKKVMKIFRICMLLHFVHVIDYKWCQYVFLILPKTGGGVEIFYTDSALFFRFLFYTKLYLHSFTQTISENFYGYLVLFFFLPVLFSQQNNRRNTAVDSVLVYWKNFKNKEIFIVF